MCFTVNLKLKKPTLSCWFTWIVFIELNFNNNNNNNNNNNSNNNNNNNTECPGE